MDSFTQQNISAAMHAIFTSNTREKLDGIHFHDKAKHFERWALVIAQMPAPVVYKVFLQLKEKSYFLNSVMVCSISLCLYIYVCVCVWVCVCVCVCALCACVCLCALCVCVYFC